MMDRRTTEDRRSEPRIPAGRRDDDVFYTVDELSRRWKCNRRYVYKLIEARCLLATRIGPRMYRVRIEDLTSYEERNRLTS